MAYTLAAHSLVMEVTGELRLRGPEWRGIRARAFRIGGMDLIPPVHTLNG